MRCSCHATSQRVQALRRDLSRRLGERVLHFSRVCRMLTPAAVSDGASGSPSAERGQQAPPASPPRTPSAPPQPHTNRLAQEQSPYLLQHQHNPVDWYPWCQEAFDRAKAEDKPIFLSVGYATCHWCHVMERESFEDPSIAALMNRSFINIKVDREERPDVDRVYMAFVQASTGRGGWPMSVWLTPDLEPFYGGTYYPKKDTLQGGQLALPSFTTVLRRLANLWSRSPEDIKAKGTAIMSQLLAQAGPQAPPPLKTLGVEGEGQQQQQQRQEGEGEEGEDVVTELEPGMVQHALETCVEQLAKMYDKQHGGWGRAPKFPRPSTLNALLRAQLHLKAQGDLSGAQEALDMATTTLTRMAMGGMYDHIGGGFHRYSVDELWHVPHFEKMGYDNPQLASSYLAAYQVTGEVELAQVARGVLDYMLRDMASPAGGFFSAEDADSLDPEEGVKKEGAFYTWTEQELKAVLDPALAAPFCAAYGVRAAGNCTLSPASDPHREFLGKNVPIRLLPLSQVASQLGLSEGELGDLLATARERLHSARLQRPRPSLDDKIVTAWNGMAISALATASRVLAAEGHAARCFPVEGRPPSAYLAAAQRCAQCVREQLWDPQAAALRRSFCKQPSQVQGFADDYAHMVAGLLDLYEAGGGLEHLQWALQLQARMDELFWDEVHGGYFSTTTADKSIKLRIKDDYDGAEPTASSVAVANLWRLAALEQLFETPHALPQMVAAAYLKLRTPLRQVILSCGPSHPGGLASPAAQALLDAVHAPYAPDKVLLLLDQTDPQAQTFWREHHPAALAMVEAHFKGSAGSHAPVVLICQNFTCLAPVSDPAKVAALLQQLTPPRSHLTALGPVQGLSGLAG